MFTLPSQDKMISEINQLGQKSNPQYFCVNPDYKRKNGHRYVLVQESNSQTTKVVKYSNLKTNNPFSRGDVANETIKRKVNEFGQKHKNKFVFIKSSMKNQKRTVMVQCVETKVKKEVVYHSLVEGKNPFNDSQNRLEVEKVQPKYENLLKKYKLEYKKEFRMGKKSIDFMFVLNGKRYGLEVKQSEKWHSDKNQLETYKKLGCLKQFGLKTVILSDPNGSHKDKGSISIKDFEDLISK
jgi:hypothetical protein